MKLSKNLQENRKIMKEIFPFQKSFDLLEREIVIGGKTNHIRLSTGCSPGEGRTGKGYIS
ncbi:MAG: hypothetical protein J6Q27_02465 [Clostridia bacterium]|nr:hypothetical protein [Clostridia bacterium]